MLGYGAANTAFAGLAILLVVRREMGLLKRIRATPLPSADLSGRDARLDSGRLRAGGRRRSSRRHAALRRGRARADRLAGARAARRRRPRSPGLGLAAAALIRSADGASAVVNLIVLPMAFLSGSFVPTPGVPAVAAGRRRGAAAEAPDHARHGRVPRRRAGLARPGLRSSSCSRWGAAGLVVASRRFGWEPRES